MPAATDNLFSRRVRPRAVRKPKTDPEGLELDVEATKSLKDDTLAEHIHKTTFKTIMGDIKFGKNGEWEKGRMLQVQYHDIKSSELDQFRGMDTETVLTPAEYKTGDVIYPFEKARPQ